MLHRNFLPLDKSIWQVMCQTALLLTERTNAENYEIFRFRNLVSLSCDEGKCRAIGTSRNSGLVRIATWILNRD